MNDEEIKDMLKELVEHIDYDIYKEMFVYEDSDDEMIQLLISIVKKHQPQLVELDFFGSIDVNKVHVPFTYLHYIPNPPDLLKYLPKGT